MKKFFFFFAVTGIVLTPFAFATLGENVSSVDKDATSLSSIKTRQLFRKFAVDVLVSQHHTVREYVSSNGKVFAVTWKGFVHPDLSVLFGTRYETYKSIAEKTKPQYGTAGRIIRTKEFVVELTGSMRNVAGRAYAPDLFPANVTAEEIE